MCEQERRSDSGVRETSCYSSKDTVVALTKVVALGRREGDRFQLY